MCRVFLWKWMEKILLIFHLRICRWRQESKLLSVKHSHPLPSHIFKSKMFSPLKLNLLTISARETGHPLITVQQTDSNAAIVKYPNNFILFKFSLAQSLQSNFRIAFDIIFYTCAVRCSLNFLNICNSKQSFNFTNFKLPKFWISTSNELNFVIQKSIAHTRGTKHRKWKRRFKLHFEPLDQTSTKVMFARINI